MGKTNRKPKKTGDSATGKLPHAAAQSEACKIGRRLILKFVGEDKPELDRFEFRFKDSTAPVFWQRGDEIHNFVWTEVPQAFALLFLDYLWSASLKSSEPFFFRGAKNGSHAASLGDAIHQPKHRIHELFIETFPSGGTASCVRRVFAGDNLHGKANRERRVSVKADFLPPDCVEVFWDGRGPLSKPDDVQLLANRIRESLGLVTARIEELPERGGDTNESIAQTPTTPGPQQPIGDSPASQNLFLSQQLKVWTLRELEEHHWKLEDTLPKWLLIDYETIGNLSERHEGTVSQWIDVVEEVPASWRLLVDEAKQEIVGYWHFVPLNEESYQSAKRGTLYGGDVTIDKVPFLLLPGHYNIYFVGFSLCRKHKTLQNFRLLFEELLRVWEELAEYDIFFD